MEQIKHIKCNNLLKEAWEIGAYLNIKEYTTTIVIYTTKGCENINNFNKIWWIKLNKIKCNRRNSKMKQKEWGDKEQACKWEMLCKDKYR